MSRAAKSLGRKLAQLPDDGPGLVERDAQAMARVLRRYYGDEARAVAVRVRAVAVRVAELLDDADDDAR